MEIKKRLNLCRIKATKIILMLIPDRHFASGELGNKYNMVIDKFLTGIPERTKILDLHKTMNNAEFYYPSDRHWTAGGHAIVFEKLKGAILHR
jgi:hypothetical protein